MIIHLAVTMATLGIKGQPTAAAHHGVLDALPGQVDHMHRLLVGAEVMQLGVGLVASILGALEGFELEVDMGSLDVRGQGLALGEGLGASLDDAMEGLQLDDGGMAGALVRLEVVELSVGLGASRHRALKDTSSNRLSWHSVAAGAHLDGCG